MAGPRRGRAGPRKGKAGQPKAGQRQAPQLGFLPPQGVLKSRLDRHAHLRRRALMRAALSYLTILLLAGATLWILESQGNTPPPIHKAPARISSLIAWSVKVGDRSYAAVIALPPGRPSIALTVPGDTLVDLPGGGPATVGGAFDTPGSLVASMQATFGQRIQHYLVSETGDFANMIDRIGGIRVLVEEPFTSEGETFGPGDATMSGGAAVEYLQNVSAEDGTGRWEDVLAGVLTAARHPGLAAEPLGATDDPALVPYLLSRAQGAPVVELPTTPSLGGGLQVDTRKLKELRLSRFPGIGGRLVRVVVLNGNGRPGIGAEVSTRLAPAGYRLVAAQNFGRFDVEETQVIAATSDLLEQAGQVRGLLGLGKVYVGAQPTGIADITIVVGKDYSQG